MPKHLLAFVQSMLSGKYAGALMHYPIVCIRMKLLEL